MAMTSLTYIPDIFSVEFYFQSTYVFVAGLIEVSDDKSNFGFDAFIWNIIVVNSNPTNIQININM